MPAKTHSATPTLARKIRLFLTICQAYIPKLIYRIIMLFGAVSILFWGMHLLPGNAAQLHLPKDATPEQIASFAHTLGLDQPLWKQYLLWLKNLCLGNFGTCYSGQPITALITTPLINTATLASITLVIATVLSFALAAWTALHPRTFFTRIISALTLIFLTIPEFIIGIFLIFIFALELHFLPAVTLTSTNGYPLSTAMYILPICALLIPQLCWNTRIYTSYIYDAQKLPFVIFAGLEGLSERKILLNYIFPWILPSISASLGISASGLFSGALAVEALFNFPGLGLIIVQAIATRDIPIVVAATTIVGICITVLLSITDYIRISYGTVQT